MGKVHEKMGNLRLAQEAWDEAIAIRQALQARDAKKQMFRAELDAAQKRLELVTAKREKARVRMAALWNIGRLAVNVTTSHESGASNGSAALEGTVRSAAPPAPLNATAVEPATLAPLREPLLVNSTLLVQGTPQ